MSKPARNLARKKKQEHLEEKSEGLQEELDSLYREGAGEAGISVERYKDYLEPESFHRYVDKVIESRSEVVRLLDSTRYRPIRDMLFPAFVCAFLQAVLNHFLGPAALLFIPAYIAGVVFMQARANQRAEHALSAARLAYVQAHESYDEMVENQSDIKTGEAARRMRIEKLRAELDLLGKGNTCAGDIAG